MYRRRFCHYVRLICLGLFITLAHVAIICPTTFHAYAEDGNYNKYRVLQARIQAEFDIVKAVQRKLNQKGYDAGIADGMYGPRTEKAIFVYQQANGLKVDGLIGPQTLRSLGLR